MKWLICLVFGCKPVQETQEGTKSKRTRCERCGVIEMVIEMPTVTYAGIPERHRLLTEKQISGVRQKEFRTSPVKGVQ